MTENNKRPDLDMEQDAKEAGTFVDKNKKAILAAVIALIVIVGGYFAYNYLYIQPREEKAQIAIFKGEEYFGLGSFEEALQGDNKGYIGFLQIANQFSGTKTGNLANAYAGICYAQLGKDQEALNYLDKFSADDALVSPAILGAMGSCYINLNQLDKATSMLVKAAEKADNNSLSPIYLMQAGLTYEKQGKNKEAVKVYQQIKDKYFASYQAMEIDKFIERASAEEGTK